MLTSLTGGGGVGRWSVGAIPVSSESFVSVPHCILLENAQIMLFQCMNDIYFFLVMFSEAYKVSLFVV